MTRQWARELVSHSSKIYQLRTMVKQAKDGRRNPNISSSTIFVVMLFFFLFRLRSMEELDRNVKKGRFRQLVPAKEKMPSHDAARQALMKWDLESHRANHELFIAKFKHNKGPWKGAINGWRTAAIDGVELFASKSRCCNECLTRKLSTGETEYFHRAVFLQKVGGDPRIVYGAELLKKKDGSDKAEGEVAAAMRLIHQSAERHGVLADVLTLDALYAQAPLIHEALDHHQHVVVRMKEERRRIMKDARGLFESRSPDVAWLEKDSSGNQVLVQAWDEEDFTSWEQLRVPFRMIRMIRMTERNVIVGGIKHKQTEILERWVGTTIDKGAAGTDTISRIAAARWDIENMGFHDLKTYWHMDHAYVHHLTAIEAILGFQIMAMNLFYAFLFGHLHHFRERGIPQTEVVEELKEQTRWMSEQLLTPLIWDDS
ncbi:transposase [Paenibacillus rubinfantis]|nr:transposase [Paenibacillus rubinfantis]